ncbi:hypothetical protein EB820_20740 [Brevibacillus agri]|uniref:MerR family transcriptional regulator n=2 Tax=Brevibacillus agri TaxID=51101 RepID=A0A3M8AIA2_9BACL|nr:hypothetical protein [Brevibacillus agri]QAV12945.1 hypothetical protein BA6348_09335 [Brevibacillus agri]QHZ55483.1 hypothetical protein M655_007395 [Brevibacillus sp. NSP2.1]RNB50966.1 hypothetical protein EB820_20740 [Brevibacillus agri]
MMMDTCFKCGSKMKPNEYSCHVCGENEMEDYRMIRNYVRSYPNSNAMQIANATGISVSKILRYIKNGSLTVVDNQSRRGRRFE